jgi:hypothetical protein
VLLATLVTIASAVALPEEWWASTLLALLQGGTLWLAFVASGASRRLFVVAIVVSVLATAMAAVASSTSTGVDSTFAPLMSLVLIAAAIAAILRHLLSMERISRSAVGGVLTVYLLIGLFFAYTYAVVGAATDEPPLRGQDTIDLSAEVYFAYITLATVGYGDLVPANDLVRGLAITEALVGQLYLVSVVALVIGNIGRPTRSPQTPPDDD